MSERTWDRAHIELDWRAPWEGRGTVRLEIEFSGPDDPKLAILLKWRADDLAARLAREGGPNDFFPLG